MIYFFIYIEKENQKVPSCYHVYDQEKGEG